VIKQAQMRNYDTNGDDNVCHKSGQQTKPTTPLYNNEWGISETNFVPTASAVCGAKTKHSRLIIKTYEESVVSN
jgi:hypothetical protein